MVVRPIAFGIVSMVVRFTLLDIQQGLEIRGFWVQKKTVQSKTVLREVYTYVLNDIFFSKNSVSSRLLFKTVFHEVTPMY